MLMLSDGYILRGIATIGHDATPWSRLHLDDGRDGPLESGYSDEPPPVSGCRSVEMRVAVGRQVGGGGVGSGPDLIVRANDVPNRLNQRRFELLLDANPLSLPPPEQILVRSAVMELRAHRIALQEEADARLVNDPAEACRRAGLDPDTLPAFKSWVRRLRGWLPRPASTRAMSRHHVLVA
jgi:hypothetical protein